MEKIGFRVCMIFALLAFGCAQEMDAPLEGLDVLEDETRTAQQAIRTDPDPAADGEITLEELEAMAQQYGIILEPGVIIDSMPEGMIPLQPKLPSQSDTCTTGVNEPTEPIPSSPIRRTSPRGDYRANFSLNTRRTIPPKTIRGGRIQEFPPNPPEIITLQDSYRAAGCANDARVEDSPCKNHPYRRAIDEELSVSGPTNNPHRP